MARKKNGKKTKIRLHADPGKIRRVWKRSPLTRVKEGGRKAELERIRRRESEADGV